MSLKHWGALIVLILLLTGVALAGNLITGEENDGSAPPADDGRPRAVDRGSPPALPKKAYLRGACRNVPNKWAELIYQGWATKGGRGTDLVIVPKPSNYMGTLTNTSHSGPYGYLQEVPLVFYGPGFIKPLGDFEPAEPVTLADVAPTYATLLGFDFPKRDGRAIAELIEVGVEPPKLIVTVSIDGGGWNVLNRWPHSWPNLARLMQNGASVTGAIVGSSPSITPATHTNISTGSLPRRHGVTAIAVRADNGDVVGAFSKNVQFTEAPVEPTLNLDVTTIGDLWDRSNGNKPKVGMLASGNYPLGMLGRGAQMKGGDKDLAGFLAGTETWRTWRTDPRWYSLPSYINTGIEGPDAELDAVDRADGQLDNKWLEHDLDSTPLGYTPAGPPWQLRVIETVLKRQKYGADEVTDLFYAHFKGPDHVGHKWNMISREERDVLTAVDAAVGDLVSWLEENIPGGYVIAITADHGQTPLEAGGWALSSSEILKDIQARFDRTSNNIGIIQRTSASSFFTNADEMKVNGTTPEQVATFLSRYTIGDNLGDGDDPPDGFEKRSSERIFAGVFPGRRLPEILKCTAARR